MSNTAESNKIEESFLSINDGGKELRQTKHVTCCSCPDLTGQTTLRRNRSPRWRDFDLAFVGEREGGKFFASAKRERKGDVDLLKITAILTNVSGK